MFLLTLVMVALASTPLGYGFGRFVAHRSRQSIRPMHRSAR